MISLPTHKTVLLDNVTCVYCGMSLSAQEATKEHVIGRRFVPKGKLNGYWNLIVRACQSCNRYKSDLEDDLSAITMHPDAAGKYVDPDPELFREAKRKAEKSKSRLTGKRIRDSRARFEISSSIAPNLNIKLDMIAPPQADSGRVFALCRMHMMAFFYFITYNEVSRRGGFWPGVFLPIMEAPESDWGNSTLKAFMASIAGWDHRLLLVSADGYFKAAIRRHPAAVCWSWALEWNKKFRIVGYFGERQPVETIAFFLPKLEMTVISRDGDDWSAFRPEIRLQTGICQ